MYPCRLGFGPGHHCPAAEPAPPQKKEVTRLKLVQLQYFKAVCKYSNITKAAAELHITQPSISNAIKDLEDEFGVKLFYRLSKGLSLTEEGRFFLEKAEDILERSEALVRRMRELGNKRRDIKIGVPPMIGAILFPHMFQQFRAQYPDIHLTVMEYGTIQNRNLVQEGALDAAIVSSDWKDEEDMRFSSVEILETEVLFCTATAHPMAGCGKVELDMIKDEPLVLLKEDSYQMEIIRKLFRGSGASPNVILYSNQLQTIKELVANNVASSVLYRGVVNFNEGIVGIPFSPPIGTRIKLIWNKDKHMFNDIAKFISFTKTYKHQ